MNEAESAPPSRRANRSRRLLLGLVAAVVAAVVAGVLVLANVYMPLTEGSATGPDSSVPGSLFFRDEMDPFGTGSLWVYCSVPQGRFAWAISLRNDGPLPVTILGGDPGPIPVTAMMSTNAFWLVDLATLWQAPTAGAPSADMTPTDPRSAPVLPPTTLASGDELEVWARYEIGSLPRSSGGTMSRRSIWVRYSVLGLVRTAEVPLRDGVAVQGVDCPSH